MPVSSLRGTKEAKAKRLPKAERRKQLLDIAMAIVREEGTDALTLGYVAERAGVSKPIAYEHFETRAGLLIALYRRLDDVHTTALIDELRGTKPRLADFARVASRSYMRCYAAFGPGWQAISAALKGDAQADAVCRESFDRYVGIYCGALAPSMKLSPRELRLRCVAIIGAGDAIANDMLRGEIDEATAAETMASLIVSWLSTKAKERP